MFVCVCVCVCIFERGCLWDYFFMRVVGLRVCLVVYVLDCTCVWVCGCVCVCLVVCGC